MIVYAWVVLSALLCVCGEYLSKRWAMAPTFGGVILLLVPYVLGTLAWLPALRVRNELAVVGTLWTVLTTLGTVAVATFAFGEHLGATKVIGIALSVAALVLLSR